MKTESERKKEEEIKWTKLNESNTEIKKKWKKKKQKD